jgi:phage gp36-like protein
MATSFYCDWADVKTVLGTEGIELRTDDLTPTERDEILDEASRELDFYLLTIYAEARLASSPTVKRWCAVVAAQCLSNRRGNPAPTGVQGKFERVIEKLELVAKGTRQIPDIGRRKTEAPVLSSPRIVFGPHPHTVIERTRSTGKPENYRQNRDPLEIPDYQIALWLMPLAAWLASLMGA